MKKYKFNSLFAEKISWTETSQILLKITLIEYFFPVFFWVKNKNIIYNNKYKLDLKL